MSHKGFAPLLIVIALAAVIGVVVLVTVVLAQNKSTASAPTASSASTEPSPSRLVKNIASTKPTATSSTTKSYKGLHYTFTYPANWQAEEHPIADGGTSTILLPTKNRDLPQNAIISIQRIPGGSLINQVAILQERGGSVSDLILSGKPAKRVNVLLTNDSSTLGEFAILIDSNNVLSIVSLNYKSTKREVPTEAIFQKLVDSFQLVD